MTDNTEDQQKPEGPNIPLDLAALVEGLGSNSDALNRAALIGAAYAGQNPGYADQQKQQAATNLLSARELDVARRAGMSPAQYLDAKQASAENRPIDGN